MGGKGTGEGWGVDGDQKVAACRTGPQLRVRRLSKAVLPSPRASRTSAQLSPSAVDPYSTTVCKNFNKKEKSSFWGLPLLRGKGRARDAGRAED